MATFLFNSLPKTKLSAKIQSPTKLMSTRHGHKLLDDSTQTAHQVSKGNFNAYTRNKILTNEQTWFCYPFIQVTLCWQNFGSYKEPTKRGYESRTLVNKNLKPKEIDWQSGNERTRQFKIKIYFWLNNLNF